MALTCGVIGCSSSAYWLKKWKHELCESCGCLHKEDPCKCQPPFRLHTFPTLKKHPERRLRWRQLLNRKKGNKLWEPSKDTRVCSLHFVDEEPSQQNPFPTLNLGYQGFEDKVRRVLRFQPTHGPIGEAKEEFLTPDPPIDTLSADIPWYFVFLAVFICVVKYAVSQQRKVHYLSNEVIKLRTELNKLKSQSYMNNVLKTDASVRFHTGFKTKTLFQKLRNIIFPLVNRRWTGILSVHKNIRKCRKLSCRFGPDRKLSATSEFLLTLMKIRLGLLNRDLAVRFNISETLVSRIFSSWLRAARIALQCLVYLPEKDAITATKPDRYRHLPDVHSLIDCTELFIETPKDLQLQGATWSDYKHHNTVKILLACSPNSAISYVSPAYTGRISDKALTLKCKFLDQIPPYSMVMADKGFNIAEDCAARSISLHIPPGKRGHSQMTSDLVRKTKHVANLRILIEQVIGRLKTFRIIKNELPITLIPHVDDIVMVCSALCNLYDPIYKY